MGKVGKVGKPFVDDLMMEMEEKSPAFNSSDVNKIAAKRKQLINTLKVQKSFEVKRRLVMLPYLEQHYISSI